MASWMTSHVSPRTCVDASYEHSIIVHGIHARCSTTHLFTVAWRCHYAHISVKRLRHDRALIFLIGSNFKCHFRVLGYEDFLLLTALCSLAWYSPMRLSFPQSFNRVLAMVMVLQVRLVECSKYIFECQHSSDSRLIICHIFVSLVICINQLLRLVMLLGL